MKDSHDGEGVWWPFGWRTPAELGKRLLMWLLTMLTILFFYGLGKLELWSTPRLLPLTAWDEAIPFIPWTVWLYGTVTWALLLAWLQVPDRRAAGRLFLTLSLSIVACGAVFVIFPTTFPRDLYPLPALDTATLREFAELREADSPSNCLPSLHVALAWGLALSWASFLKWRWARALPLIWAAVVSVCTLTTKQHYLIDVPAGAAVALVSWLLAWRGAGWGRSALRARPPRLLVERPDFVTRVARLREKVERHQWDLEEVAWPEGPLPPLDPSLVRLINEIIYIEEIAGLNFRILAQASEQEDLRVLYTAFADEEQRHARGLRRVLSLHGASLRAPGLGNTLVLDEFDALDATYDADVYLVAVANPVFETFLDAGTVPFLRSHPALKSDWFEDFVRRVCRDEAAHLALNWTVIREAGERHKGWRGLRLLLNPSIYKGILAVPFMSLDVYSLAHQMGYQFRTLLPSFKKLWRLHKRYPELAHFPLWWVFRVFVVCGAIATWVTDQLQRFGVLFIRFWTTFTRVTDFFARVGYGNRLLRKRRLPSV